MADPFIKAAQSITKQMLSSPTISLAWQYWFNAIGKLIGEKIDTLVGAAGKVAVVSDQGGIKSGEVEIPVGATGYLVDDTTVQTVSNKTLSGTTITDLTLIQHDHGSTAKGGAIIDGDLTRKGAVQLSNSYAGTLQTKATTEKALSDGLAHVTQLVDANANVTVKSVDNTAGSGDYLTVKAGTTSLPVVLVSADGTESAVGILVAAKGDTQYFQIWGGSGQYKGARFVAYGRDHSSTPGKAYLDFGGYDSTGQIIFRHRLTSSFLTVFTMDHDGDLTLVGDVDTAAGKKYLVNGAQHTHDPANVNFAATDKLLGRATTGAGSGEEVTCTAAGRALLDDADAATQRITLSVREKLTATRTYYVRTDGNDANTGLVDSAAGAFLTIQKAWDVAQALDGAGQDIYIYVRAGTYTAGLAITTFPVSPNLVAIVGDDTTPANVTISTAGQCVYTQVSGVISLSGFAYTSSGGACIDINHPGAMINLGKASFGSAAGAHIYIRRGYLQPGQNYTITAGAVAHIQTNYTAAFFEAWGKTITITGTPAFSTAFAFANGCSLISIGSMTYTGAATGSIYSVNSNAVINTYGDTLPGDAAGTTATGGVKI
jgi:hypothetical protein